MFRATIIKIIRRVDAFFMNPQIRGKGGEIAFFVCFILFVLSAPAYRYQMIGLWFFTACIMALLVSCVLIGWGYLSVAFLLGVIGAGFVSIDFYSMGVAFYLLCALVCLRFFMGGQRGRT